MVTKGSSGKSLNRRGAQAVARADSSKPLVLVVEDHQDIRDLLRYMLTARGFGVAEAENGEDAIDMAERLHPGLILMDCSLPRLDGVSATRRMRERETLRTVPIVFLSGHAEPAWETEARDAGCDDYLVKPFRVAQLDRVLAEHLPLEKSGTAVTI